MTAGNQVNVGADVPARCHSCHFYRAQQLDALRSENGQGFRCDLSPGNVGAGTLLACEGASADRVFAVRAGLGRVLQTQPNGRVVALRLVGPGELVGTEAMIAGRYAFTFEAVSDLQFCSIDPDRLTSRAISNPLLASELHALLTNELQAYRSRLVSLAMLDRRGRVCELLLQIEDGGADEDGWFELPLRQQEIAEYLGSTQETVSRVLGELKRLGWIERKGRRTLRIVNRDRVEQASRGELERPAPGRRSQT